MPVNNQVEVLELYSMCHALGEETEHDHTRDYEGDTDERGNVE